MSPAPKPRDVIFFASPAELRAWFDAHHETADELWVGYHRKATGRPTVTWPEAVGEALCVGWIDGVRYRLDDERNAQRFTPRRKGSFWSAINTRRAGELIAEGRMRPAGLRAFEARSPEKTAIYSYERDTAAFTKEQQARFEADEPAWAFFRTQAPSYRRSITHWVSSAKRDETRERRFEKLLEDSRRGRRTGAPG
ncbi:MAG TPA: YdeI/OmpD-associated family protein [Candidatus Limnocylindrales bacterium]|nr:YdeI/OmpD-associated family protein [Candidatus Limnocylindrales bacterium]